MIEYGLTIIILCTVLWFFTGTSKERYFKPNQEKKMMWAFCNYLILGIFSVIQTVSLSSSEAEYQALSECVQKSVFTQNLVPELTGVKKPAILYEDNLGTIFLVKNQQVSSRTKHIDIRHHLMRGLQEKNNPDVRFKRSENNSADIMTNNTTREDHDKHSQSIKKGALEFRKKDVKQDSKVFEFPQSRAFSPKSSPVSRSLASSFTSEPRTPKRSLDRSCSSST
jgi:hypothetical protein